MRTSYMYYLCLLFVYGVNTKKIVKINNFFNSKFNKYINIVTCCGTVRNVLQ